MVKTNAVNRSRPPLKSQNSPDDLHQGSPALQIQEVWERVTRKLRTEIGEEDYTSWFPRVVVENLDENDIVHLSVPTKFLKSWIETRYAEHLVRLWQEEDHRQVKIALSVRSAHRPQASGSVAAGNRLVAASNTLALSTRKFHEVNSNNRVDESSSSLSGDVGSCLDARYSFSSFVVGPANIMAFKNARAIASGECTDQQHYSVLYIHAPVGFGKTHLLQATAAMGQQKRGSAGVVYLTAERFMYRFVGALRANAALCFKERIRGIEILLIDDMQFLQGRSTQQEFCHTLNELIDSGRRVIVAADRPPAALDGIEERVRSRLASGLVVNILPFDCNLRMEILRRKLQTMQKTLPGLSIGEDVLAFIAKQVSGNGRDLDGVFNRLVAHYQLGGIELNLSTVKDVTRDLIYGIEPHKVKIEQIQRVVSKHFDISKQEIVSDSRNRSVVRPRQISMYLAKMMTDRSLPEIGRRFGDRDHTTVLHAVRKIERLAKEDPDFADEIEMLKHMVEN